MPHLLVHEQGQVVVAVPLRDGLRAGRHEKNDLVLTGNHVSRQHVEITRSARGWEVTDLGSTHGTRVNGEPVKASPLRDGDRIQVGDVLLTFFEDDEPRTIVHHQATAASPPPNPDASDRRLRLIYEVSRAVGAMGDADEVLGQMLSAILDVLGCERAMAGLCDSERGPIRRVVRTRGAAGQDEIVVSRAILEALLGRREGVIIRNEPGQNTPKTLVRERILSAMGVPLQTSARLLGFLYVDDREQTARFTPQDLEFLAALSHLTAAAVEGAERLQRASAMAEALGAGGPTDEIVGASEPMSKLKAQIHKFGAASGTNVLIRGESGTGKELVARALHAASPRSGQPIVTLNCAAIPETMIEAELFGYDKGAFTGAVRDKRGKFELADRGTLFLDEIGDLNLTAQAKVLRAVQEGEIQPLGSERTKRVNVRILSATHKDLRKAIEQGSFREDLYYRLAVVEVLVPPLRDRGEDVEVLAHALLKKVAVNVGKRLTGFTPAALASLRRHRWPGNVRELRNEVERAAINAESSVIGVLDLSPTLDVELEEREAIARPVEEAGAGGSLAARFAALEPTERDLIKEALAAAKGNLSEAARLLGITRIMIKRRVDRFGLGGRDGD
jgi:Nif-specific regulatory protein